MKANLRVEIPDHVMIREVGGECVLLDLETEKYFGLDDVGTDVLRHFREGATLEETVARIVAEYEATTEQVNADVRVLLSSLVERGLVRTVDNG